MKHCRIMYSEDKPEPIIQFVNWAWSSILAAALIFIALTAALLLFSVFEV
jgi:hypothetical protein